MIVFFYIITLTYALFVLALIIYWEKIPLLLVTNTIPGKTKISIIIAVRNEEQTIELLLEDLNRQSYSKDNFEVLVVDDYSTDNTRDKVNNFQATYKLRLITFSDALHLIGNKKRCIEKGIEESGGDLIITTDGDCRVGENWISSIEDFYVTSNCKMITGPVCFFDSRNIFKKIQALEFATLIGSGAACLSMGKPNMCNGANLAYEKKVFYEVEGFKGNEHIPSGDDEFLMHKVYQKYPHLVKFLKNKEAVVYTDSKNTIKEFVNQRKRWASKWSFYKITNIKIIAFIIFLFNATLIASVVLVLAGVFPPSVFLEQFLLKVILEFVFLRQIFRFFGKKMSFLPFLLLLMIHPFYVVFFALGSLTGTYEWKEREINLN